MHEATDRSTTAARDRLELLARALSGLPVTVADAGGGDLAWTTGRVIHVDASAAPHRRVAALAVQAALLACGSLRGDVLRQLRRRPALARSYLAIEGRRALAALAAALPPGVAELDRVGATTGSPAESLAAARLTPQTPPDWFGTIRPNAVDDLALAPPVPPTDDLRDEKAKRQAGTRAMPEDADHEGVDFDLGLGGARGGLFARLLKRTFSLKRQSPASGPAGTDAPTHMLAVRPRDTQRGFYMNTRPSPAQGETAAAARGLRYPEWDPGRGTYRHDWCTVQETPAATKGDQALARPRSQAVRRALARLGTGIDSVHRQVQGDDIDIDAAIDGRIAALSGSDARDDVYIASQRRRRDLSVLVLLDVSGSTREPATHGGSVHEGQCVAAATLVGALHELGDRVALYGFRSQGRSAVSLLPIKTFAEDPGNAMLRRLHALEPGGYSRLGAAIRHGAATLLTRGGTQRRLLVVLSDGLAYDHGYELDYGAADASRALSEARGRGIGCLCLSVGAATDAASLGRVFGSAAHAIVPAANRIDRSIGPLFRSALRAAEVRRDIGTPAARRAAGAPTAR